jgi:predicted enzyme related to lactoylglutathione lyase
MGSERAACQNFVNLAGNLLVSSFGSSVPHKQVSHKEIGVGATEKQKEKEKMTSIGPPVPELPVADVERAQQHYRDALGFDIGWLEPDKGIGSVSRGKAVIFFRRRKPPFEPAIHWSYAEDIDATYQELKSLGANIVEPLEKKPWGLRQFAVKDLDGNVFYFHHG